MLITTHKIFFEILKFWSTQGLGSATHLSKCERWVLERWEKWRLRYQKIGTGYQNFCTRYQIDTINWYRSRPTPVHGLKPIFRYFETHRSHLSKNPSFPFLKPIFWLKDGLPTPGLGEGGAAGRPPRSTAPLPTPAQGPCGKGDLQL